MHFQRLLTFSLLFHTVLLNSCQQENAFDCVKSTGKIVTETRSLPEFRRLKVSDNLNVKIVADTAHFVEVRAGENLQENIQAEVKNGELWLQNINKCNWVRSYKKPLEVTVHALKLTDIFQDGFGTISSEGTLPSDSLFLHLTSAGDYDLTLKTRTLWLDMYETGDMKLQGTNGKLNAFNYSMGRLQASGLQNKKANILVTHLGDAYIEATDLLSATIENKANVYYKNQPDKVSRQGNGEGQLIQVK
ncbi:head GIN domain-containing protein [Adhaeribacter terreus]|uniref:Head GIN domain-containing protein n=1 Tax=Adhaeribacter terreus TaxID=529703 RepID=A0ABW0EBG3_9BACT